MRYLALEGGTGRLEPDGSVAVLGSVGCLSGYLRGGGRLGDLASARVTGRQALDDVELGSVAAADAAMWGIGLNYRSKQRVTGRSLPEHPTLFLKSPTARVRPGDPVRIPSAAPDCVDYEGEIAVVVGQALYEAPPPAAAAAVTAVVAANDVTARDVMRETRNASLAKSYPSFGQLGSAVLDPSAEGGFGELELTTRVNGETRQSDRGDGLIMPVAELLSLLSRYVLIRPGDVVLTGTPAGTGDETKTYLAPGDVVEVEVARLPALRSVVVDGRGGQRRRSQEEHHVQQGQRGRQVRPSG